ncbi:MAG: carboxypeptidase-like regulatory domain-containing protein, partial [Bryobacteraceae bacterium]
MIRRMISAVLFLALLASVPLIAQTFRGGVAGAVTDATGAAVANAPVRLVSPETGLTRDGVTSSAGDFVFQDLPLGKYNVTVTQPGFET